MKIIFNKATSHILFVILVEIFDIFKHSLDGQYGTAALSVLLVIIWGFNYWIAYKSLLSLGEEKYLKSSGLFMKSVCLFLLLLNVIVYIEGTLSILCPVIILMVVITAYEIVTIIFAKQIEWIKRWLTK